MTAEALSDDPTLDPRDLRAMPPMASAAAPRRSQIDARPTGGDPVPGRSRPIERPSPTTTGAAEAGSAGGLTLSLSALLRGAGALTIVAAFLMYLFQGWRDGDELTRYVLLLAHTGVLSLAGFALGHLLHEAKGARLFIALALAAVPVNFAFLGGMLYPHFGWDPPPATGTVVSLWQSAQGETLTAGPTLLLAGIAAGLLAPAIWLGFLVMARRSALPLAGLYLLANAALLIPTRNEGAVALLLLGLAVGLAGSAMALRRRDATLGTPEGRIARAVLALPLLVLAGRTVWLYAPDALFFAALALTAHVGLRQAIVACHGDRRVAWLEAVAVALGALSGLLVYAAVSDLPALPAGLRLPVAGAVLAGLLLDLSTLGTPRAGRFRAWAVTVGCLAVALDLALLPEVPAALAALAGGLGTLAYGYGARRLAVFVVGLVTALAGLGVAAEGALARFSVGGWTGLVLLGIVTVVAGSLLERHGPALKAAAGRWQRHFQVPD